MMARISMYHTVGAHMMGGRFLWIGLGMSKKQKTKKKLVSERDARSLTMAYSRAETPYNFRIRLLL